MDSNIEWLNITSSLTELFSAKELVEIDIKGKKICIALHQNQLYACAAKCPHASGHLVDGFIDAAGNIVCPLHRYKFKLSNGFNTSGEGYYLKTYPIKMTGQSILIGLKKGNWFNF